MVDAGSVALPLARSLADAGRKVVLVDLAGTSADFAGSLEDGGSGLADLVKGDVSFVDAIRRDRASPAHMIAHGRGEPGGAGARRRLDVVFDALGLTYDFVLVLGPPADADDELVWLSERCSSAILVTADSGSDPQTLAAYRRIKAGGIEDVIVLLAPTPVPLGRSASA
jgi:Mrp family chromosome partitioning ATPase